MIKVLIADDHPVVRAGLKQILGDSRDMCVVGEASNGQEVLDKVHENHCDVVLLDISMPRKNGLDVIKQLTREKSRTAVLVLSIHPEEQYAIRVLRAGASGYLTKENAADELIAAIRKVSLGRKYVSPSLAERLASDLGIEVEEQLHQALSDREYQVMCMIASGKTTKEIAEELSLSPKTISTYRSRILGKMKMKNNAQVVYYAIRNGLVT